MRFQIIFLFSFLITLLPLASFCQHQNDNWVFGDSAGINFFNPNSPTTYKIKIKSRGTCSTISDSSGLLIFYYAYDPAGMTNGNPGANGQAYNKSETIMPNGDSILSELWYHESLIIPNSGSSNLYYLFTIGVAITSGFYFSTIDMTLDSGRGDVVQKNVQLLGYPAVDGLTAIKHGNGRDWWIFFRTNQSFNNDYYFYLINPTGISGPFIQNIGSMTASNIIHYCFNKSGTKLAAQTFDGLIETFDFDRCTGLLSNHKVIRQKNTNPPSPSLWGIAFSPSSRFLYLTSQGIQFNYLIQIDLQNAQPWNNADTLWIDSTCSYSAGALKLGKDEKIYFASAWYDGVNFNYPYPDSVFNIVNSNLSVINMPDSLGSICSFQPYSFSLGGARTYIGLPNNPDYDLGPLKGSPCDTLQWANLTPGPSPLGEGRIQCTYISAWQKLFINASGLKGKHVTVRIYDGRGKAIKNYELGITNGYATVDVDCSGWSDGLYVVHLETDKEWLSRKFIKE